jgi:hypothetical protein
LAVSRSNKGRCSKEIKPLMEWTVQDFKYFK